MEIGRRNIHSEDELDQIRKGEGAAGDSNCHYILGLPIEHPMTQWSLSLDTLQAKSVNPAAVKHYYNLLENVLKENNFPPHNIYGFDESGYPLGRGMKHCTIWKSKSKQHKMQLSGSKEMVTVIATICANGSNVPPVVIF